MARSTATLTALSLAASVLIHAALHGALRDLQPKAASRAPRPPTVVEIAPRPEPPELPEPPPEPREPQPETPAKAPKMPAKPSAPTPTAAPPPNADPEPQTEAVEPVADLTGLTLTHAAGSWSAAAGSGAARSGPIRAPGAARGASPRGAPAAGASKPSAPELVPLQNLSAPPKPPVLADRLRAKYPPEARAQGLGGEALVRARVDADGRVRYVRLVRQSAPGFGDACRQTLIGSTWSAPIDKHGRAVATLVSYHCQFEVQ